MQRALNPFREVERELLASGFEPDYTDYESGGVFRFYRNGNIAGQFIPILIYSSFGHFIVELDSSIPPVPITEESNEYKDVIWYKKLLSII